MAYEQRDNSGTIFVNDRKETEKHPDRTGTAMIDGVMYYVSGWIKEGAKGKFMSLAFKRKDGLADANPLPRQQSISERAIGQIKKPESNSTRHDDMNDDIPF